ncbi:winged helix-turn-helix transcriptional regulator [Candidatus Woesearchaeota archaeon]|nr:winged helix-turn-helix transcriptional regulator [Candidatus Woesearchaeota archaeon]
MIQNYTRYRILRLFFDYPTGLFQIREVCRKTNLTLPTVRNHLKALEKDGFIRKQKVTTYPSYKANPEERFQLYKRNDMILRLHETGLIEHLNDSLHPNVILLFGSASKGQDHEGSDIDIFLQAKEQDMDLSQYEKTLNRDINLFFAENPKELSEEFRNSLANGIVLSGYLDML